MPDCRGMRNRIIGIPDDTPDGDDPQGRWAKGRRARGSISVRGASYHLLRGDARSSEISVFRNGLIVYDRAAVAIIWWTWDSGSTSRLGGEPSLFQ